MFALLDKSVSRIYKRMQYRIPRDEGATIRLDTLRTLRKLKFQTNIRTDYEIGRILSAISLQFS